jgi:hypothetical protein
LGRARAKPNLPAAYTQLHRILQKTEILSKKPGFHGKSSEIRILLCPFYNRAQYIPIGDQGCPIKMGQPCIGDKDTLTYFQLRSSLKDIGFI